MAIQFFPPLFATELFSILRFFMHIFFFNNKKMLVLSHCCTELFIMFEMKMIAFSSNTDVPGLSWHEHSPSR